MIILIFVMINNNNYVTHVSERMRYVYIYVCVMRLQQNNY